jgi:hypothetical protein
MASRGQYRGGNRGGGKSFRGRGGRPQPYTPRQNNSKQPATHDIAGWEKWVREEWNPPSIHVGLPVGFPGRELLQEVLQKQYKDLEATLLERIILPHLTDQAKVEKGAQATANMALKSVQDMAAQMSKLTDLMPALEAVLALQRATTPATTQLPPQPIPTVPAGPPAIVPPVGPTPPATLPLPAPLGQLPPTQ